MSGSSIFVMVDMEGISGVVRSPQVSAADGGPGYQAARRYMTQDASACAEGCFRGGAERVVIRDAHSFGFHMLWDELDPRCELIQGNSGIERMPHLGDFDALILLGYHAMAGTRAAILEHTMSSVSWQNFWINGVRSGEIAIDAAIAGDAGVPTIMVSGDDKACAEARSFLPGVITAEVKKGLHCQGGQLLSRQHSRELLIAAAEEAVRKRPEIRPYKVGSPVNLRLELVSRGEVPAHRPPAKVIDGRTYEVTAPTMQEALHLL